LMDKSFLIAGEDNIVIDQITSIKKDINAKSIQMPIYTKMDKATTPLVDGTDVDAPALEDTEKTLTPVEYGNAIVTTLLAKLQTGGMSDRAGAKLVGINMRESLNAVGLQVGEAGSNVLIANGKTLETDLVATDVIQDGDLSYVHNRLHRANVPKFDSDLYVAVAHPDVLDDIKLNDGFEGVQKYADAMVLLKNELGIYKGFRWLSSTGVTTNSNAGNANVDTYHTQFYGQNGLGKAVSKVPTLVITGPFDKLGRTLNIGWLAVVKYELIDTDAQYLITSASTYGAN